MGDEAGQSEAQQPTIRYARARGSVWDGKKYIIVVSVLAAAILWVMSFPGRLSSSGSSGAEIGHSLPPGVLGDDPYVFQADREGAEDRWRWSVTECSVESNTASVALKATYVGDGRVREFYVYGFNVESNVEARAEVTRELRTNNQTDWEIAVTIYEFDSDVDTIGISFLASETLDYKGLLGSSSFGDTVEWRLDARLERAGRAGAPTGGPNVSPSSSVHPKAD